MSLVFEASPWQMHVHSNYPAGVNSLIPPLRYSSAGSDRRDLGGRLCGALSAKYLRGYWSENWEL